MKQTRLNIVTRTEKYPIIIGSNLTSSVSKIFESNSIYFNKCLFFYCCFKYEFIILPYIQ